MRPKAEIKCLKSNLVVREANKLAAFFGHPCYLVGSQLTSETPRDIDLVVIIPDNEFVLRYINQREVIGHTDLGKCQQWGYRFKSGLFDESNWQWAADVSHKSLQSMKRTSMNIDLKVYALSYHLEYYSDKPLLKISEDNFPELIKGKETI